MFEFYTDFDEILERFAIMTVDGEMSDESALERLSARSTSDCLDLLQEKLIDIAKEKAL